MATSIAGVFQSGAKTVAAAGTAEALAGSVTLARALLLVAKPGNTGQVYVGGSDVASSTNGGLAPGDTLRIVSDKGIDLAKVYIDVGTNADGVDWYASV